MPKAALRNAANSANPVATGPSSGMPAANPTRADDGEDEADELGELQRWDGFAFGDRAEPGRDEVLKDPAVRVLAGSAPGADREDHRLKAEDHGRTGID